MQRAENTDHWFVVTTMKCVEDLAVLKGTGNVTILSHFFGHSCSQQVDPYSNPYGVPCYSTGSHVWFNCKAQVNTIHYASRELEEERLSYSGGLTHAALIH